MIAIEPPSPTPIRALFRLLRRTGVGAVEWTPKNIKFFFDGSLIVERIPADLPAGTSCIYDHPLFILLNLAVGSDWPGSPGETTAFPQHMPVDYIRVYSRVPATATSLSPPTNPGAPYLDSEMWASSAGRPLSAHPALLNPKPAE